MAEEAAVEEEEQKKKGGLMPLLVGLALAIAGGGAGFGMVAAGLIGGSDTMQEEKKMKGKAEAVAFVPLEQLIVSVGAPGSQRHLRFQAQLEVAQGDEAMVAKVLPRVTDILNGYLRAVDVADIEDPAALVKLRAQMLRRVQIVVGEGLVTDLLISEFVLS